MRITRLFFKILKNLFIVMAIVFVLVPITWTFLNSFHYFKDIVSMNVLFGDWTLHNYELIFFSRDENVLHETLNSIVYVASTLGIVIPLSIFAGYGFSRLPHFSKFKWIMLNLFMFSRILPGVAIAVPYFVIYQSYNLYNTYLGLILIYVLRTLPLAVFMVMTFIEDVPREIEESAMIDGASTASFLRRILIPLISPGLVATAIFVFIYAWDDYIFVIFLGGKEVANLQIAVAGFNAEYFIRWGEMCAATMFSVLPIILFILVVQKHLVRGLTLGAIKG